MLHRIGLAAVATVLLLGAGAPGHAQNTPPPTPTQNTPTGAPAPVAPGEERACLVTFNNEAAVAAGANINVLRAQLLLPRAAAAQAGSAERIMEFGEETVAKCTCLNDPATRATC